ncbi:MAG: 16S rRNA (adenine(1518)-N(6)/adenine(1519)-N(6))-dimethyltransferase RsmA [Candidatus Dasytiphilus stammeri]
MINNFYLGHFIRKNWGQIFIKDANIINNIISAINPQNHDHLVEIGPGLGALTQPISKYVEHITAIEIDKNLVNYLKNNAVLSKKLTIYQRNALNFDFNELSRQQGHKLRIFGNLPYNLSSKLIFHLFKYTNIIKDMHLMLQKEVVDRIIAVPDSKKYGRLSVMSQYYCKGLLIQDITPESFIPVPKVSSALVRLVPYTLMPNIVENISELQLITRTAFSHRRKILKNSLSKLVTVKILKEIGINPNLRAENISVALYCKLANWLAVHSPMKLKEK